MTKTSAHVMAHSIGVDPKVFRIALDLQEFAWHPKGAGWSVETGSPEHQDMIAVLGQIFAAQLKTATLKTVKTRARARSRKKKKTPHIAPQL